MAAATEASLVLLDTSPFYYFDEAGHLRELRGFLNDRCKVTRQVDRELRIARDDGHIRADIFDSPSKWPRRTRPLPDVLDSDFQNHRRLAQEQEALLKPTSYRPPRYDKHSGEVETALMAHLLNADLVVMDDGYGKKLLLHREIARVSTAALAVQMQAAGVLTRQQSLAVYLLATPDHVGMPEFEAAVARGA
jgi:hypothetical protein